MEVVKMDFNRKYKTATHLQRERYHLLTDTIKTELSDDEKRYVLWLAGWDAETATTFSYIFAKLTN
jgi:hypothetical protein